MPYSVAWRRDDGALCERSLALDPLTRFLARLETPATVTDARGRVVGEVYSPRENDGDPGRQWRWYVALDPRALA